MTGIPHQQGPDKAQDRLLGQAAAAVRFTAGLPFKIAARLIEHTIQILFAVFVLVLHPQAKWLYRQIAKSAFVRSYIQPSLQGFFTYVYDPYFAYLSRVPPLWATFSIALPLAVLEPGKLFATILIAERPRTGIILWLTLQGLSLILIDRTWTAVRPQSRKIRLVARFHAWVWLNTEHGKYWIKTSAAYETAKRWKENARRVVRRLRLAFLHRRGSY